MKKKKLVVGCKVQIKECLAPLKHRFASGKVYGSVTHIDGEYISVRPKNDGLLKNIKNNKENLGRHRGHGYH